LPDETDSIKMIPIASPFFDEEDISKISEDVKNILKSKRLVLGPYTQKFEDLFSEYIGTKYSVAVSSGTAALEIVLRYCNVKDSEVIIPTNTFISCPNTVLYADGKPIFADMKPNSFCVDIDDVQRKISQKTKVVMAVHLGGYPDPEMEVLREICDDHEIYFMEDCSHSHGASLNGRKVGSLGVAGCFSFYATKLLATGTGGMLTTNDPKLKLFAEELRRQGSINSEGQTDVFDKLGYDWMMSEVTASLGISQLSKLDRQIKKRKEIANHYENGLSKIDTINPFPHHSNTSNVYWRFITMLDEQVDRNKLLSSLKEDYKIGAGVLYPILCHMQPVYRLLGHNRGECPVAENAIEHQLTLPVNPYMTSKDVHFIVEALNDLLSMIS
jgi:perosamine synthetase